MTDTPRTDAVYWKFHSHDDMVNLARDLERELAISLQNQVKAQTEVERLKKELAAWDYGTRAKREQERAEKAEANLRRAIEIAEALSSELYFPDFVAEIASMKTSLSSPSSL